MNLAIIKLIADIFRSDQNQYYRDEAAHVRPSAPLRMAAVLCCILLCALSRNAWFTMFVLVAELLRTAMKPPVSVAHILRPVLVAVLFAVLFTLPAVFLGSPGSVGTITMKVAESVLVLSLMNEEVSWKETTGALQSFHLPGVVILTLDSTIRFLVILGRFSGKMLEAVSLRRVGRKNWRNAGTGGILGTTFLKSQDIAQKTSEAMLCRGFNGTYRSAFRTSGRFRKRHRRQLAADLAYCLVFPALIIGFLYTQAQVL